MLWNIELISIKYQELTELEKEVNRLRWLFIMLNKLKNTITYFNQSFLSK